MKFKLYYYVSFLNSNENMVRQIPEFPQIPLDDVRLFFVHVLKKNLILLLVSYINTWKAYCIIHFRVYQGKKWDNNMASKLQ